MEDSMATALHSALEHLELPDTYIRMFIYFSSTFITISSDILEKKLADLDSPRLHGIKDFFNE